MKKTVILLIALLLLGSVSAQNRKNCDLFTYAFPSEQESYYGQVIKKKRSGMGILSEKSGAVYAGDFKEGKRHGMGMYFAPKGRFVEGCDSCIVYVGDFVNGKKHGMGICYNAQGIALYYGNFEKDKPVGVYPDLASAGDRAFLAMDETNAQILAEVREGKMHGLGLFLYKDGRIMLSQFKKNEISGVGLYVMSDGNWQLLNWKGEEPLLVSSSYEYNQMDENRKRIQSALWKDFRSEMVSATTEFVTKINSEMEYLQNIRGGGDASADSEADVGNSRTSKSKGRSGSSQCKKCKGSGNCMSHGRRNSCFGTGVCQYCDGVGWNVAGNDRTPCASCKNHDGKCKWCKGTGKCEACGGKN